MEQEYGNGWAAGMESCVEFAFTVREFGPLLPRPLTPSRKGRGNFLKLENVQTPGWGQKPRPQRGREHRGGSKVKIIPVRSIE
jgi:hypothetical protein